MWDHLNVHLDYLIRRKTFPGWEIRPRYLKNFEFVLILGGRGTVFLEDQKYCVEKGDFFFFHPGLRHSMIPQGEPYMEFYGAEFSLPEGPDSLPLPDYMHLDAAAHLEALFRSMLDSYRCRQTDPMARWKQNLTMEEILYHVLLLQNRDQEPVNSRRIQQALNYINEDPFRKIRLQTLLEISGIRKTLFLQQFHLTTGMTPVQYIREIRMETARELLLETDSTVSEVAEQCGFSDALYFSRCFKKQYSLSPQQYRKTRSGTGEP